MAEMERTAFASRNIEWIVGNIPRSSKALVPEYLAKLPVDTFSTDDSPIHYRPEGKAYVLWTVFLNGVDDGGRDSEDDINCDDICLRPVPKPAAK